MRIRSIKPEFWRSSAISSLDWETRLLFIGLWSYVDDNGVGRDKLASITADLFADDIERDAPETFARVSRGLQTLSDAGRITRYEVDGKRYLAITNWSEHQKVDKPNKPRFPEPNMALTRDDANPRESVATSSRDIRETPSPVTEEQRSRGTEEETSSSEVSDPRPDIEEVLDYLDAALAANGSKIPTRSRKNVDAARLLLDRDGKTIAQVKACIDFATTDEFWRSNILSMSKLREKYDQLRLKAQRQSGRHLQVVDDDNPLRYWSPPEMPDDYDGDIRQWTQEQAQLELQSRGLA